MDQNNKLTKFQAQIFFFFCRIALWKEHLTVEINCKQLIETVYTWVLSTPSFMASIPILPPRTSSRDGEGPGARQIIILSNYR